MDPIYQLDSFQLNFSSSPFPLSFQLDFSNGGAQSDQFAIKQSVELLQETLIPPFLSKTYDLVDDPSLNPIISWSEKGNSFVVWEPAYLATIVLPRFFKHDNFSSFVRQLNSYGFRKIDADKWEFANEFFLRGSKHLLKNIQRRKSPPQLPQVASEGPGPELETEVEKLRTQKSLIMQEMAEIQLQQCQAAKHMEAIKQKLVESETRQKKMLSFLANAVQNPEFIEGVVGMKEQSPTTRRKIVKPKTRQQVKSSEMEKSSLPFQTEPQEPMCVDSNHDNGGFSSLEFGHNVDFPESSSMSSHANSRSSGRRVMDTWQLSDLIYS